MAHHLTTCTFCGVGCGLYLETSGNQVVGVYPSRSHPTNAGRACVRGWHVHEIASSPDRLHTPLIRTEGRFEEVSWDDAFKFIAKRLQEIRRQHGPDSLAFLNAPRCSNEEAYLFQKFARTIIGTNNVDHGTGVYGNNSIDVLLDMIGVPATTNSISELPQSEVIFVDGVDLARRLPTLAGVVIRAKLNGARLIVMGNRRHRVAENAEIFLQIRPGTEPLLYGAMTKIIWDRGLANLPFIRAHCRDFDEFLRHLKEYDLLQAAEGCGVSADSIEAAAVAYASAKSAAILYSAGIEARSQEHIRALVNLALVTGNLGKPGAGIFSLGEQNNLQGVCDMGMLPDRLPGYRPVADDAARAEVGKKWNAEIPSTPGMSARTVLSNHRKSKLKALWLCRYDPVSTAALAEAASAIRQCEFVVVQHLFMTDTAQYAHVILPTTAYGEEQVSFTSTDRRIQLAQKVVQPSIGLTPAWEQIVTVARRMGADWHYQSAAEVMREIGEVVPFYSGADYENLAKGYGRQWPCTQDNPQGTAHLFANTKNGNSFHFSPIPRPPILTPPRDFPFTLIFGHALYYWNQNVLVRHSETLKREYHILLLDYPQGFVEINTEDAKGLGIRDGQRIRLCAATASAVSTARVTPEVRPGTIFVPYFVREIEEQVLGAGEEGNVQVRVEREVA